ncbi:MAG TPA: hypothetical protein VMI06_14010 [Terriglobia bacterium]|nr:hypothetical protein [Terriglobia bacterium]
MTIQPQSTPPVKPDRQTILADLLYLAPAQAQYLIASFATLQLMVLHRIGHSESEAN